MSLPDSVIVWACNECGSYYASSSVGDLSSKFNSDNKGNRTFSRARCPTPACAAKDVIRTPLNIPVSVTVKTIFHQVDAMATDETPITDEPPRWLGEFCIICGKQLIAASDMIVCSGCGKVTSAK